MSESSVMGLGHFTRFRGFRRFDNDEDFHIDFSLRLTIKLVRPVP